MSRPTALVALALICCGIGVVLVARSSVAESQREPVDVRSSAAPTSAVAVPNPPTGDRLRTRIPFFGGLEELVPAAAEDTPAIPASAALAPLDGNGEPVNAARYPDMRPVITLARFTNHTHGPIDAVTGKLAPDWTDRLVWAVVYVDVPGDRLSFHGPPGAKRPTAAEKGVYVVVVDATTGADLEEFSTEATLSPADLGV